MNKTFKYNIDDEFLYSEVILKGGERHYYVEGYASTIDEDKSGEIIGFEAQKSLYNQIIGQNITMDIEHEEWYNEKGQLLPKPKNQLIPVAKVVDAELRPRGVWVKAEINRHLSKFDEVWNSIKDGFLKAFSVAFYPITKSGRTISALNLVNITLTGSPVNPNATFNVTMKSAKAYLDSLEDSQSHPLNLEQLDEAGPVSIKSQGINLNNPADTPTSPASTLPPVGKEPEIKDDGEKKMEKENEFECKECDKKFDSKEAYNKHMEENHAKKEDTKAEKEVEDSKEDKKEDKAEGESKKQDKEEDVKVKALQEEVARLKAELAKPVMKSIITEVPKPSKEEQKYISPTLLASMLR